MAWIRTVDKHEARGELAEVYRAMAERKMPAAYLPPHGGAPGIIRAHSLDPRLMQVAFATSATNHQGELDWAERELISAAASRANQCFY